MAYTPNPADPSQPVDTQFAKTAAAEFRALKAYIQTLVAGEVVVGNYTRNLFRNPLWVVNQRAAGTVTAHNTNISDAWRIMNTITPRISAVRVAPDTGFGVDVTITLPGAPAAGGDIYGFQQAIEGVDFDLAKFGTANAKTLTLSFDVVSPVAGDFYVSLYSLGSVRSYLFPVTVTQANVLEHKTIVIPGDTVAGWATAFNFSLAVRFCIGAGVTFQSTIINQWTPGNFTYGFGVANPIVQTAPINTIFRVLNTQLEIGAIETPFTALPIALESARSGRYFNSGFGTFGGVASGAAQSLFFQQEFQSLMRIPPVVNLTPSGGGGYSSVVVVAPQVNAFTLQATSSAAGQVNFNYSWTADADF